MGGEDGELGEVFLKLGKQGSTLAGVMGWARHPGFPVDTRHNAKIKRERLTEWARSARVTWAD